jgi:NADP-dependent 3-hydroxy acid dehydrogenase YdfG
MQVAIVTGASSGIGFGTAVKLAGMGMAVVGTGRDAQKLAELLASAAPSRCTKPMMRCSTISWG